LSGFGSQVEIRDIQQQEGSMKKVQSQMPMATSDMGAYRIEDKRSYL
jgi:hypothetical protein